MYIQSSDLLNYLDQQNLAAAMDDFSMGPNGPLQTSVLNGILQGASDKSDSFVCSIYQTPFSTPPAKIKQAAIVFACFMVMSRRLTPSESNPFKTQNEYWEKTLISIGNGELPLDVNFPRAFPPLIARTYRMRDNSNIF